MWKVWSYNRKYILGILSLLWPLLACWRFKRDFGGCEKQAMKEEDFVFDTDGIQPQKWTWMWYCPNCRSTFSPYFPPEITECPDCHKGKLVKAKVEDGVVRKPWNARNAEPKWLPTWKIHPECTVPNATIVLVSLRGRRHEWKMFYLRFQNA